MTMMYLKSKFVLITLLLDYLSSALGWRLCRQECGSISLVAGLPVISQNLRDISTPFGFVETKKRDAVLWKQDSFYPVPCFQVRFKRWQDCATLLESRIRELVVAVHPRFMSRAARVWAASDLRARVYEWIKYYWVYGQLLLPPGQSVEVHWGKNANGKEILSVNGFCRCSEVLWVWSGLEVYECITRITGSLTRKLKQRKPSATCTPNFASPSYCANIKRGKFRREGKKKSW